MKKFIVFINENYKSFKNYFQQIENNHYLPLTKKIWNDINIDGYVDEVNDYNGDYDKNNYSYTELIISTDDKDGLINFNNDTIEKWNDFDIEFKNKYYPDYIDYIDYDNGKIYIIKYK